MENETAPVSKGSADRVGPFGNPFDHKRLLEMIGTTGQLPLVLSTYLEFIARQLNAELAFIAIATGDRLVVDPETVYFGDYFRKPDERKRVEVEKMKQKVKEALKSDFKIEGNPDGAAIVEVVRTCTIQNEPVSKLKDKGKYIAAWTDCRYAITVPLLAFSDPAVPIGAMDFEFAAPKDVQDAELEKSYKDGSYVKRVKEMAELIAANLLRERRHQALFELLKAATSAHPEELASVGVRWAVDLTSSRSAAVLWPAHSGGYFVLAQSAESPLFRRSSFEIDQDWLDRVLPPPLESQDGSFDERIHKLHAEEIRSNFQRVKGVASDPKDPDIKLDDDEFVYLIAIARRGAAPAILALRPGGLRLDPKKPHLPLDGASNPLRRFAANLANAMSLTIGRLMHKMRSIASGGDVEDVFSFKAPKSRYCWSDSPEGVRGSAANVVEEIRYRLDKLKADKEKGVRGPYILCLEGETGSGKGMLAAYAAWYWRESKEELLKNKDENFLLRFDIASYADEFMAPHLFGWEQGAFTGAVKSYMGPLEAAILNNDRPVFLDEIGELSTLGQQRLLTFLATGTVLRLGAVDTRSLEGEADIGQSPEGASSARGRQSASHAGAGKRAASVRTAHGQEQSEFDGSRLLIITATNKDLRNTAKFRSDLCHRLMRLGVPIVVPPLRDRSDFFDLGIFDYFFWDATATAESFVFVENEALEQMQAYGWPGNFRELEGVVTTALYLARARARRQMEDASDRSSMQSTAKPEAAQLRAMAAVVTPADLDIPRSVRKLPRRVPTVRDEELVLKRNWTKLLESVADGKPFAKFCESEGIAKSLKTRLKRRLVAWLLPGSVGTSRPLNSDELSKVYDKLLKTAGAPKDQAFHWINDYDGYERRWVRAIPEFLATRCVFLDAAALFDDPPGAKLAVEARRKADGAAD